MRWSGLRVAVACTCIGLAAVVLGLRIGSAAFRNAPGWDAAHTRFTLPNGWRLTPAGTSVDLPGDMPGNILFVDGGAKALVNTCGYHDHSVNLVDLASGKLVSTLSFKRSWIGLTQDAAGDIYVSGGSLGKGSDGEAVHRAVLQRDSLCAKAGFHLEGIDQNDQFVSGLLAGREGLYVLNVQSDEVLLLGAGGAVKSRASVAYRPYGLALSPDGLTLAVSNWGNKTVQLLDPTDLHLRSTVDVQSHPTSVVYAPDGRLFVANAGANTVSVVSHERVVETIRTGPDPTDRIGSTPVALAVTRDGARLYVADAGNNCVTVVDVSRAGASKLMGFIPTSRYPTAVAVTPDGKRLLVATAKGLYGPNAGPGIALLPAEMSSPDPTRHFRYIGNQLSGALAMIDVPSESELARYTKQVMANDPAGLAAAPGPSRRKSIEQGAFSEVHHVIYVIRENRTYDQVLGDIGRGNSDPSLTLFGKGVTPNAHRLANEFVLLDNLYTDGEVSQCGHQWTDAAYANDYNEKQWILSYSRRGEVRSDTRLTSSPGDYIWELARKHGLTARVFGEYVSMQEDHDAAESAELKADPEKYGFSAPFERIFARGGRDTEKVAEFLQEMRDAETSGRWPNLMVMALPEDHTRGLSPGALTPTAMVGNNDLAIGQLIDGVSHSKFWRDTALFIIEDDAQNGPDHVDSHRTVGLAVSPYARRGIVDHTMYSTSSMLRTIELILGLPPMTEYDEHATPMYASFTEKPNFAPYAALPASTDLNVRNPRGTKLALRSSKLDFSDVDRADPDELNHILWETYKPGVPYPAPVRFR